MKTSARLLLSATLVLSGLLSISGPAAAVTETVGSATLIPSQPKPPALPAGTAGTATAPNSESCDEVVERHKRRTAITGQEVVACVVVGEEGKLPEQGDMRVAAPLELPQYCYDNAFDGQWWGTREEACRIRGVRVDITNVQTGQLVGQLLLNEYAYAYGSSTTLNWAQQVEVSLYGGWGTIAGTTVDARTECSGACTTSSSDFPRQSVILDTRQGGEAYFRGTSSAVGSTGNANASWHYRFYNPAWVGGQTTEVAAPYPTVRCDNAVPGYRIAGCIWPDWPGVLSYQWNTYPELANHIWNAQQSGLPGAYPGLAPNGSPLTRLTDETLKVKNRNKACPTSYPRPSGKSCDEYPFASTYQGASTGGGTGRTLEVCSISALPTGVTGATGYSACMINAEQNSEGGTGINKMYQENRILDRDPFHVWIWSTQD